MFSLFGSGGGLGGLCFIFYNLFKFRTYSLHHDLMCLAFFIYLFYTEMNSMCAEFSYFLINIFLATRTAEQTDHSHSSSKNRSFNNISV